MKIIRDFEKIGNYGSYIQKSADDLRQEKIKIQKLIDQIPIYYKGIDADQITNNFLLKTEEIDILSENIQYLGSYMQQLAAYDKENLQETVSSLNQLSSDMNVYINDTTNLQNSTINLENNRVLTRKSANDNQTIINQNDGGRNERRYFTSI